MRQPSRVSTWFFLLLIACAGCDDTRGTEVLQRDPTAPIQTSALHYDFALVHLGIETTIHFVYRNQTADSAYLLTCPGWAVVEIQKQVGDVWNQVWPDRLSDSRTAVRECPAGPTLIAPGAEYRDSVSVFAGRLRNQTYPQFAMDRMDGVYRLVLEGLVPTDAGRPNSGAQLELDQRVSNPFSLSAPPGFP